LNPRHILHSNPISILEKGAMGVVGQAKNGLCRHDSQRIDQFLADT